MFNFKSSIIDIIKFAILGAIIFALKMAMAALPNINVSGVLILVYTVVYGKKALIPMYVYIFLEFLGSAFSVYTVPYLYVWAILWACVMFLPQDLPTKRSAPFIYAGILAAFGLLFGTLTTPAFSIIMGMDFEASIAWIVSGLPYDLLHGIGNFCLGFLAVPLIKLLRKLESRLIINQ